jgi:uncharacterized protein (DUF952 family)
MILHICNRQDWERAQNEGEYRPASLETEGFIHASRPEQIPGVANRFYHGLPDLLLLVIDPSHLRAEIRWETVDGDVYPHIFGPINLDAIAVTLDYRPDADGIYRKLPPG